MDFHQFLILQTLNILRYDIHDIEHNATGRKLNICPDRELTENTPYLALTGEASYGVYFVSSLEKTHREILGSAVY